MGVLVQNVWVEEDHAKQLVEVDRWRAGEQDHQSGLGARVDAVLLLLLQQGLPLPVCLHQDVHHLLVDIGHIDAGMQKWT